MPYPEVLLPYEVFRRPGLPRTAWRLIEPGVAEICVGLEDVEAAYIRLEVRDQDEVAARIHTVREYFDDLGAAFDRAWDRGLRPDVPEPDGFPTSAPNRYEYEKIASELHGRLEGAARSGEDGSAGIAYRAILDGIDRLLLSPWVPIGYHHRHQPSPQQREDVRNILEVTHEQHLRQMEQRQGDMRARQRAAEGLRRNQDFVREWKAARARRDEPAPIAQPTVAPSQDLHPPPLVVTDAAVERAGQARRARLGQQRRLGTGPGALPPDRRTWVPHPIDRVPLDPDRMWKCPTCTRKNINEDDHCVHCGAPGLTQKELGHFAPLRRESGPAPHSSLASVSALRACGYQITGMSREQRWRVLTAIAIPNLGLRQVVETIKLHIRLREGQRADYSYAIGEWEHDLARLRRLS